MEPGVVVAVDEIDFADETQTHPAIKFLLEDASVVRLVFPPKGLLELEAAIADIRAHLTLKPID